MDAGETERQEEQVSSNDERWEEDELPATRAATRRRLMLEISERRREMWKELECYQKIQKFDETMLLKKYEVLVKGLRRKQVSILF